jgi:hypothetical protein
MIALSRIGEIERRTLHKASQDGRQWLVKTSASTPNLSPVKIRNHSQTPAYSAVLAGPGRGLLAEHCRA